MTASPPVRVASWLLRRRWFVRAPLLLYRHRLGLVFGSRLLMLEHTGRRSGLPRQVVLETVAHPDDHTFLVMSGFGLRSQWYRNVLADPRVRVSVGRRRQVAARAVALPAAETPSVLGAYAARHPRTWRRLRSTLEQTLGADLDQLPVVRLELTG